MKIEHYESMARSIRREIEVAREMESNDMSNAAYYAAAGIAKDFARLAASNNPDFNTKRFLTDCGL